MRKYDILLGDSLRKINLKISLLSTMNNPDDLWEFCSFKQLWDDKTLEAIVNGINTDRKRYANPTLFSNVIDYLIPHGGVYLNITLAELSIKYRTMCLIPYLKVSRGYILNIITNISNNQVDDLYILDLYIRSGKLIPKYILELLAKSYTKKNKLTNMLERTKYEGIKCNKWEAIFAEYCTDLLSNRTTYEDDKLDTLYLSVVVSSNFIKYNNSKFSVINYWERGGSLFLLHTDVETDINNFVNYVKLIRHPHRFDIEYIHFLSTELPENIEEQIRDSLYIHQINNTRLYYKLPRKYRIPNLNVLRSLSQGEYVNKNPLYDVGIGFIQSIKHTELDYNDIELYFQLGGQFINMDEDTKRMVTYDIIASNSKDFHNLEVYLSESNDDIALRNAIRKSKAIDFSSKEPNVYGVCGSDNIYSKLDIMQFANIFSTKGTYVDTVCNNPILLKYYKPSYLSIVDYTLFINSNSKCANYVDLTIFPKETIITMLQSGIIKLNHHHFKNKEVLLEIIQSNIDLTFLPINIIYLYKIDEYLAELYINRLLNR